MAVKPNLPSLNALNAPITLDGTNNVTNTVSTTKSNTSVNRDKTGAVTSTSKATKINDNTPLFYDVDMSNEIDITNYNVFVNSIKSNDRFAESIKANSLAGVEGIPYQFLPTVDRRIDNSSGSSKTADPTSINLIGRKYMEKIVSHIPLLFLAPCDPAFMDDKSFSKSDRSLFAQGMFGNIGDDIEDLLTGGGRFYSAEYNYGQYYNYLNAMLTSVATYMGISKETIKLGDGTEQEIGQIDWRKEYNTEFAEGYFAKQSLAFYMDSIDTISESFANSTTQSQFAGLINGFSDTAKEIDYFFGSSGNVVSNMRNSAASVATTLGEQLSSTLGTLGGGIVGSIAKGGVASIIDGGKIVFPEMWSDSSYDKSYSISIKLRSPDNDRLSIFLNILKPYCKLLCLTLPHMIDDNVNTYRTPFICKAYCKGLFNIDLGMITGLSVSKGATCAWNDDGLPTQIDIDLEIKDLYSQLTMTGYVKDSLQGGGLLSFNTLKSTTDTIRQTYNIVNNTAYQDFLANMAGLNINEMEPQRKYLMYYDLFSNELGGGNLFNMVAGSRIDNLLNHYMRKLYTW